MSWLLPLKSFFTPSYCTSSGQEHDQTDKRLGSFPQKTSKTHIHSSVSSARGESGRLLVQTDRVRCRARSNLSFPDSRELAMEGSSPDRSALQRKRRKCQRQRRDAKEGLDPPSRRWQQNLAPTVSEIRIEMRRQSAKNSSL